MRFYRQLVWIFLILGLLLLSVLFFAFSLAMVSFDAVVQLATAFYGDFRAALVGVLFFILAVLMIRFFLMDDSGAHTLIDETELGEIRVTLAAVDSLIKDVLGRIEEVGELSTRVRTGPSGVQVALRLTVDTGASVPELTENIQKQVKEALTASLGITVETVEVFIRDIRPVKADA